MTDFKVGDRVIFLNEKGGGVITRIVDNQIVLVAGGDGFEIPYAVKDLLKAGGPDQGTGSSAVAPPDMPGDSGLKPLFHAPDSVHQIPRGVYLAMIPSDQDQVLNGQLDMVLMNHSEYQLLWGVFLNHSGAFQGLFSGTIKQESLLHLETIERAQIEDWANGLIQVVFFRDGKCTPLHPVSAILKFRPVKIYKEDSFQYEALLRKKAFIVELATIEKQAQNLTDYELTQDHARLLKEKMEEESHRLKVPDKKESFLDKHKVDDKIAEVDLHIGELSSDHNRMSNVDMLNLQMNYVRKCFDEARMDKLSKIIFIHGIGNGTLKNELLRFLRQTDGIEFYDAPYARYGLGATEVSFYKHQ